MEGEACYTTILGTDTNITEIETDVDNDRVLLVVKDSYGNAAVPFYVTGFSKVYIMDFRYADVYITDMVEKVGATDVLFSVSITSSFTPDHIESIKNRI